jgi:hypothetical protein
MRALSTSLVLGLAGLVLGLGACSEGAVTGGALRVESVLPATVSARGGDRIVVSGQGFAEGARLFVGGAELVTTFVDSGSLEAVTPPSFAGTYELRVEQQGDEARLPAALAVRPLDLAFAELPSFALPVMPGPSTVLAASPDGLVAGGAWGLAEVAWKDGTFTSAPIAAFEGDEGGVLPAVRALALSQDGALLVACVAGARPLRTWTRKEGAYVADRALEAAGECGRVTLAGTRISDPVVLATWAVGAGQPSLASWRPGGELEPLGTPALSGTLHALVAQDLDGDGDEDVAISGAGADGAWARVWARDSVRYVDLDGLPPRRETTRALVPLDVDGDGDLDLFGAGSGSDALWVNDGLGRFVDAAWHWLPFDRSEAHAAASADLDRDGLGDLVLAVPAALDRLFLSGPTGFRDGTPVLGLATGVGGRAVALVDLDRDGDVDVATLVGEGLLRVRFAEDAR